MDDATNFWHIVKGKSLVTLDYNYGSGATDTLVIQTVDGGTANRKQGRCCYVKSYESYWLHGAATWANASSWRMPYRQGRFQDAQSGAGTYVAMDGDNDSLVIGYGGWGPYYANGRINCVRIMQGTELDSFDIRTMFANEYGAPTNASWETISEGSFGGGAPTLTSIAPNKVVFRSIQTVTIRGTGFGDSEGASYVQIGDSTLTVSTWSDTSIVGRVKKHRAGRFSVIVNNGSGADTLTNSFWYVPMWWNPF